MSEYDATSIEVLEGLAPVRKRPAMYIGGTDKTGYHHLLWEVLDNSIDEVIGKHATRVLVTLHSDGKTATVEDNGRGIPIDVIKKHKKSALEVILTTLHAGGKFDRGKSYVHSGGLHGVGASVVNALSSSMTAQVKRDGKLVEQTYARGKPKTKLKKKGAAYQGALEAVLAVLIATGIGYWADTRLDSSPVGVFVGAAFGFLAMVLRLVRMRSLLEPDGGPPEGGTGSAG